MLILRLLISAAVIFLIATLSSCCDEKERIWLSFENPSGRNFQISVFYHNQPKIENIEFSTDFVIAESENMNISPTVLINNQIDSICVTDENGKIFNYLHDSEPFKQLSVWKSREIERDFPTNFCRNHTSITNFYYEVLSDSLVN
jgi:hypothetical protein